MPDQSLLITFRRSLARSVTLCPVEPSHTNAVSPSPATSFRSPSVLTISRQPSRVISCPATPSRAWAAPSNITVMQTTLKTHLQSLCIRHRGKLTPQLVLDDASRKSSPIHHLFTWDDSEAAQQYRLLQAAEIIRRVKVKVHVSASQTRMVRAYVNIENPADDGLIDRKRVYVPVVEALRKAQTRDQVINALHREAMEWKHRAEAYEVFAEICKAIKRIKR